MQIHNARAGAEWRLSKRKKKKYLISLSHVAVEDSSHTLDGRMLQFMGPPHVVVNAPGPQGKKREGT